MNDANTVPQAHSAHVQVLTAEVRTLVVGSRQITMSVYNQLDTVPPGEIEPFGRVNARSAVGTYIDVIGRHTPTGALATSFVPLHAESLDDEGRTPWRANTRHTYGLWRMDVSAERQRQQLADLAAQWSALPLIVLAGLR